MNYFHLTSFFKKMFAMLVFSAVMLSNMLFAQSSLVVPFAPRVSPYSGLSVYNLKGDFIMMGNTNLTLTPWEYTTTKDHNNSFMWFVNTDPVYGSSLINSSSSTLRYSTENNANPSCSHVMYAGLYWTGRAYNAGGYVSGSDSIPIIRWGIDTSYRVVSEVDRWYTSAQVLPTSPPTSFIWNCSSSGGPGHSQVFDLPGVARIVWSSQQRPVTYLGGVTHPLGAVYYPWIGPGSLTFGAMIQIPGGTWSIPSPSGGVAYGFYPISFPVGIDTVQFVGMAANANCSAGDQQLLVKYKTMEAVYTPKPLDTTWYHRGEIKFRHNNDTYNTLRAQGIRFPQGDTNTGLFVGYADITEYVNQYGEGAYWVADMPLQSGQSTDTGLFGGWGMVVVYENEVMEQRSIVTSDGYAFMRPGGSGLAYVDIPMSGFQTALAGNVGVKVGVMSGGGAINRTGDQFGVETLHTGTFAYLNNPVNASNTNFFASTIYTGSGLSGLSRNPSLSNNTGMSIIMMDIPNVNNANLGTNQTSTRFRLNNGGLTPNDNHVAFCLAMSCFSYLPEPEVLNKVVSINGVSASTPYNTHPGDTIEYSLELRNRGTEALVDVLMDMSVPYLTEYVDAWIITNDPRVTGRVVFNPAGGINGAIEWHVDMLPVPGILTADFVFAELHFRLRVTEDCSLLATSGTCDNVVILDGDISGKGGGSGVSFGGVRFIYGYEPVGACETTPIRIPIAIKVDDNCAPGMKTITACVPLKATTFPFELVRTAFPRATRFYDTIDFVTGRPYPFSVEYTSSNPFPPVTDIYYAIPSAYGGMEEDCFWEFTIVSEQLPNISNIFPNLPPSCGGEGVNLINLISYTPNYAVPVFYEDPETTLIVDAIVSPSETRDYYVKVVLPGSLGCFSDTSKITVTVLPTITQEMIDAIGDTICASEGSLVVTADLYSNITNIPRRTIYWYDSDTASNAVKTGTTFDLSGLLNEADVVDTTFYVGIEDLDELYCSTPKGDRKQVHVRIHPTPTVTLPANKYNLCGPTTIEFQPHLEMGSDISNTWFVWERQDTNEAWVRLTNMSPVDSGEVHPEDRIFYYTPQAYMLEQDSFIIRLTIVPNVCPPLSESVVIYSALSNPNAGFEIVEEPQGAQNPCDSAEYILKITEAGIGGLGNIHVSLEDYMNTNISVAFVDYLYPVEYPIDPQAWRRMTLAVDPENMFFNAAIPALDNITIENGDSLLVRFTAFTDCGFYADNDFRFRLRATDACSSTPIATTGFSVEKQIKSNPFKLNFNNQALPLFWIKSWFDVDTINNIGNPVNRTVKWTTYYTYEGGDPITSNQSIYFNMPVGMTVHKLTNLDHFYNMDSAQMESHQTQYTTETLKDYQIPLSAFAPSIHMDTMRFEIEFTIDEYAVCGDYEFRMEIIHEEPLYCPTIDDNCTFGSVRYGSYNSLTIDLYSFEPYFEVVHNEYHGQFFENGAVGRGSFRIITHSGVAQGHELKIVFYPDINNNGFLENEEIENELASIIYPIDRNYSAGDTIVVDLTNFTVPTKDSTQFLVSVGGKYVCTAPIGPITTIFGKQHICLGATETFYTAVGDGIQAYQFQIGNNGNWTQLPQTTLPSERRYTFNSVGTYTIATRYVATANRPFAGTYLNWAYIDVNVYADPILGYVHTSDTTICNGTEVELTHFIRVTNNTESIIYFYEKGADGTRIFIGSTEENDPINVTLRETTAYRVVAVNPAGCASDTVDFTVNVNPVLRTSATVKTQPTCTATGSLQINIEGGSGSYSYSLDSGKTYQSYANLVGGVVPNLAAGSYIVYVQNEVLSCSPAISERVTLTPNNGLYATAAATDATACATADGEIKLWADLGEAPYQYSTDGINFIPMPLDSIIGNNFLPETYTFWVRDNNGCKASTTATVTAGAGGMDISLTVRESTCGEDGMLFIDINGTGEYRYRLVGEAWKDMLSNKDSLYLDAGERILYIEDKTNGCIAEVIIEAGTVSTLTAKIDTAFNVVCEGTELGKFIFSVTGGTAPYAYSVNTGFATGNGAGPFTVSGLQIGAYEIVIKDFNGCSHVLDGITIGKENEVLTLSVKPDSTICSISSVYLPSMILNVENADTVIFYTSNTFTTSVPSLTVNTTGWRYVRAYNKYNCNKEDSVYIKVLPMADSLTITAASQNICTSVGEITLHASAGSVNNPVFRWYDQNGNVVETNTTGDFYTLLPSVTASLDTIFYVSVEGDNYCENLSNNRRKVTVSIYPEPMVLITTKTPSLCGELDFRIDVKYDIGRNLTGATYQWYYYHPTRRAYEVIPNNTVMQPNTSGPVALMGNAFAYDVTTLDIDNDSITLMLSLSTPVCGNVSSEITVYVQSGNPDGEIEIVSQPMAAVPPCDTVYYVVKVTETGDGGLSNINVMFRDWAGSLIGVEKAEYFYDELLGWDPETDRYDTLDWEEIQLHLGNYEATAIVPDNFILANGDSLLIRFTATTPCGFYAGNDYHLALDGTDGCGSVHMGSKTVTSQRLALDFNVALPDFWLESEPHFIHINNNIPIQREVVWTVNWGYLGGGTVDEKQSIYFNIPTGMSLQSIKSIPPQTWYNYDITVNDAFLNCMEELVDPGLETCYDDPETKEYQLPLPKLDYTQISSTDTFKFEVRFLIDEGISCQDFLLYMEIVHEDSLYCPTLGAKCKFGFIRIEDSLNIQVDLYAFDMYVEQNFDDDCHGYMSEDGTLYGGCFKMHAGTDLNQGHTIDFTFYADLNNNGILDDEEIDAGNEKGVFTYTIDDDYTAGSVLEVDLGAPFIETEEGKQLLAHLGGIYVCATDAFPLANIFPIAPLYGTQTVCEGDTAIYYTASGMLNYNFQYSPFNQDSIERIPLIGESQVNNLDDTAARFIFKKPGTYTIMVNYTIPAIPGVAPQKHVNNVYIDVVVTERPILSLTGSEDTTICEGAFVELTQFVEETTGVSTTIEFYQLLPNGDYAFVGDDHDNSLVYVNPPQTTVYRAVAYNQGGCYALDSLDFKVIVNHAPQVWATITAQPNCNGGKGTIQINANGGSGNYKYNLDGGSTLYNMPVGDSLTNLEQGNYTIYLYDMDNMACSPVKSEPPTILTPPAGVSATAETINATGCGNNDGSIKLTATNGSGSYQYSTNGGLNYFNLPSNGILGNTFVPGPYTILVKDIVSNCVAATDATIEVEPGYGLEISFTQTAPAICDGEGTVEMKVAGGVQPYSYHFTGGYTFPMLSDSVVLRLGAGTHVVYVQDKNNCFSYDSITIVNEDVSGLTATIDTIITPKCEGTVLGSVKFTTNAAIPYSYSLNDSFMIVHNVNSPTVTINGLHTGTYQLKITNDLGCTYIIDGIRLESERDMPRIVKKDTIACLGTVVDLRTLILPASQSIETMQFYYEKQHITEVDPPVVDDVPGYYHVRAYNSIGCFVDDSIQVRMYSTPELTVKPNVLAYCAGDLTFSPVFTFDESGVEPDSAVTRYTWYWISGANTGLADFMSGRGGISPTSANVTSISQIPKTFPYSIGAFDLNANSITVEMQVTTQYCGVISDQASVILSSMPPQASLEIVAQPVGRQDVCEDTAYVFKVTELGSGGLTNIKLILDDYFSSWISVDSVEYLYPIEVEEDDEFGVITIVPNTDWKPMDLDRSSIKYFTASIPTSDNLILLGGDSLLVRYTVKAECGFLGGLPLLFTLEGNDACEVFELTGVNAETDAFRIDWTNAIGSGVVAEYDIWAELTPAILDNSGVKPSTITLSVSYVMLSGTIDYDKEGISINVPFALPYKNNSLVSTDGSNFYNGTNPTYKPYEGETMMEWRFPLRPGLTAINDTVTFDIELDIDDWIACGDYTFYVEVMHEDSIICNVDDTCSYPEILNGDYPVFTVDLYHFTGVATDTMSNSNDYYGVMKNGEWSGVYLMQTNTPIQGGDSVMLILYADMNGNNLLDAVDIPTDTIYYPTIPRNVGDLVPIYIGQPIPFAPQYVIPPIHPMDGKQIIAQLYGSNVCGGLTEQIVPLFGTEQVCQGDTITYYTAGGMRFYNWGIIFDSIKGMELGTGAISDSLRMLPWSQADSEVRVVFREPGKYVIYTHYAPSSGNLVNHMLSRTYMEIEVTPKPYLELTNRADTAICQDGTMDLSLMVRDATTGSSSILYYEQKQSDGTYVPIISSLVNPMETTTYRVTAKTANGVCDAANSIELTVNVQTAPRLEGISIIAQPNCNNTAGALEVIVTDGSGNYQYSIDDESTYHTLPLLYGPAYPNYFTVTGLSVGTYTLYIKDAVNSACPASFNLPVSMFATNSGLTVEAHADSVDNCSSADGRIKLTVNGGEYPYYYSLNGGAYLPYPSDGIIGADTLKFGHYDIMVRDAAGCFATTGDIVVHAKNQLGLTLTLTHEAQCTTNGMINIEVSGGTVPYFYHVDGYGWVEMSGTVDSVHVLSGHRYISVKDALGCETSDKITVTDAFSDLTVLNIEINPATCIGNEGNASVFWTATNTPPLFYSFDNFVSTSFSANVSPLTFVLREGVHTLTLRDALGCIYVTESIEITTENHFLQAINNYDKTYMDVPIDGNLVLSDYNYFNESNVLDNNSPARHGSITIDRNGFYSYKPDLGYVGLDTIRYTVSDGCYKQDAYLYITVLPLYEDGPRPPIAQNDKYYTFINIPIDTRIANESVLDNDKDPEGRPLTVTLVGSSTTKWGGTVTLLSNGTFVYTPRTDFIGVDEYWYSICNDVPLCDSAIVYIYVRDSSKFDILVRAFDDEYTTAQSEPLIINPDGILHNDIYPDYLDSLVITDYTLPKNGTLTQNDDGSFTYMPGKKFFGSDGYTYTICGYRTIEGVTVSHCSRAYVNIFVYNIPCADMPVLYLDSGYICQAGNSIDLNSLIKETSVNVFSVEFYADQDYTQPLASPFVKETGIYYIRAFNESECFEDSFVYVTAVPIPILSDNQSICYGNTLNPLELTGSFDNVVRWEYSTDNFGSNITPVANTTTTLTIGTSLRAGIYYYRTVVQTSGCPTVYSNTVRVEIINREAPKVNLRIAK